MKRTDGTVTTAQILALDELGEMVYRNADAHGFHAGEVMGDVSLERLAIFVSNLHSEVSELWEAARKGKLHVPCDKQGCGLTNLTEELADIIIRTADTAHAFGVSLGNAVAEKHAYNMARPYMHGKKC